MPEFVLPKDQIMEDYLTSLLTDVPSAEENIPLTIDKLLEKDPLEELITAKSQGNIAKPAVQLEQATEKHTQNTEIDSHVIENEFQALFFDVAGLILAVPLTELGGIHKVDKIAPLFGKPNWFKGVMLHKQQKLNVVDTANWVMPEKYSENIAASIKYKYLILLNDSSWGLACEAIVATRTLQSQDVKWRTSVGKRPWLAGTVKDKMCVLINVKQLVALLDKGFGSNEK